MKVLVVLFLLLLPWPAGSQSVRVTETPAVSWVTAGEARVGGVYVGASGELLMVCDPPMEPADSSHHTYGVRPQPKRQYLVTTHFVPGYGTFTIQHPGPVYAVNLRDGSLYLLSRSTWLRPARWKVAASVPAAG